MHGDQQEPVSNNPKRAPSLTRDHAPDAVETGLLNHACTRAGQTRARAPIAPFARVVVFLEVLLELALFLSAAGALIALTGAELGFRSSVAGRLSWLASGIGNARDSERRAEQAAETDPQGAVRLWRRAVLENPRSTAAWIALGLAAEGRGDTGEARSDLERAARVDHLYLPAWTLANFCFRHRDEECFWRWARRAAALAYDDLGPLIALADREPAAGRVGAAGTLDRLGGGPRLEHAYLDFLVGQASAGADRWGDAEGIAERILARMDGPATPAVQPSGASDAARLSGLVDHLIEAGRGAAALKIWSGMERRAGPPGAGSGGLVANGDFLTAPSGRGFDWRLAETPGVSFRWSPGQARFRLEATRPEVCVLLDHWIELEARSYRLRFEYRTPSLAPQTGLRWVWEDGGDSSRASGRNGAAGSREADSFAASEPWRGAEWVFAAHHAGLEQLRLVYLREPGAIESEGEIWLRHVRLEGL